MLYSFAELCRKEVIDVEKGEKLGYVDDLEFDAQTAAVAALVIHGRERLFGTDTILVVREAEHGSTDSTKCTMSRRFHIEDLFK